MRPSRRRPPLEYSRDVNPHRGPVTADVAGSETTEAAAPTTRAPSSGAGGDAVLVVCALPRSDPGSRIQFYREAGKAALSITSVHHGIGLPYGTYPRLIMAWITTEALRTRSRVLRLGRSLSEFMDELDVKSSDSGGRWGVRTRFTGQLRRLMACAIDLQFSEGKHELGSSALLVEDRDLWWDTHKPTQGSLFDSRITLSKKFFEEILAHPVPFDVKVLRAMKRSSLGLDLYGRIPDFPVTRSHPPASWPSAANSSICRTYRKTAGEESRRRSPVANRWMRP